MSANNSNRAPTRALAADLECVSITDKPYSFLGETNHQFRAHCHRCLSKVQGPNGNTTWQTKASAVRNAREHLAQHERREYTLLRWEGDVIDVITPS